jgi:hypothetical protein
LTAAVDPVLGRVSFRAGLVPTSVEVTATVASPGPVGAGGYERDTILPTAPDGSEPWFRAVGRLADPVPGVVCTTLTEAITDWQAAPAGTIGVIAVVDSRSYVEDLAVTVPAGSELTIAALTWPQAETANALTDLRLTDAVPTGRRPHLRGSLTVTGTTGPAGALPGELTLDGVLVEGGVTVAAGDLGRLALRHSTLVPDAGGVAVETPTTEDDDNGQLVIGRSPSPTAAPPSTSRTASSTAPAERRSTPPRPRPRSTRSPSSVTSPSSSSAPATASWPARSRSRGSRPGA